MRIRLIRSLFGGCVLTLVGATSAFARDWLHAKSPNFEMFSLSTRRESQDLLRDLELFRGIFFERLGLTPERTPKTTIVLFRRDREFDDYKPMVNGRLASMAGVCVNFPDATVIALSSEEAGDTVRRIIFHEYVHQLVGAMGMDLPPWMNEGLAELFKTIRITSKDYQLGIADPVHVGWLRGHQLIPLARLFAVKQGDPDYSEADRQGVFYAQSWALLHYCMFGRDRSLRPKLLGFIDAMERTPDRPLSELFEENFGMDYAAMEAVIDRFIHGGGYYAPRGDLPANWSNTNVAEFKEADPVEVDLALADLRARLQRDVAAGFDLWKVADQRPDDPRPFESLAAISFFRGEYLEALGYWEKAAERNSTNAFVYVKLAERELGNRLRSPSLRSWIPEAHITPTRRGLERALELDPINVEAVRWLAWLEALAAEPDIANVNRVQAAVGAMRDKDATLLAIAIIRWRLGDAATARQLADRLQRRGEWEHAGIVATLRKHLDGG